MTDKATGATTTRKAVELLVLIFVPQVSALINKLKMDRNMSEKQRGKCTNINFKRKLYKSMDE